MVRAETPWAAASARTPSSQGPKAMLSAHGAARSSPAPAHSSNPASANVIPFIITSTKMPVLDVTLPAYVAPSRQVIAFHSAQGRNWTEDRI
jgi:hypothetical protein